MLHYESIDTQTLELLKRLLEIDIFRDLRLVGGTALALQMGHRKSIDLELFGILKADDILISHQLNEVGSITILKNSANIHVYLINEIKVDIVNYPYHWIEELIQQDNLKLAGLKDIAAMKLSAITGRGTKKDFVDLYFLLQQFQLKEILGFYRDKYKDGSELLVLKSLAYFIDADEDENPVMIKPMEWGDTKDFINNSVEEYLKSL